MVSPRTDGVRPVTTWPLPEGVEGRAVFSSDGAYRYRLDRHWDDQLPGVTFVLLNPSRATAEVDDPTTRKLEHLTAANGGGSYVLVNLFASVDTHQSGLHLDGAVEATGAENDRWVEAAVVRSRRVVVGWGTGGGSAPHAAARRAAVLGRVRALRSVLGDRPLWCVGHNRGGSPRHPGRGITNQAPFVPFVPRFGSFDGV